MTSMPCLAETIGENTKLRVQVQVDTWGLWVQDVILLTEQSGSDCNTDGQLLNLWFDKVRVANPRAAVKAVYPIWLEQPLTCIVLFFACRVSLNHLQSQRHQHYTTYSKPPYNTSRDLNIPFLFY